MGIPQEETEKIFDRFYRVDKEHSRTVGGTGLGLYIVKWIADSHGDTTHVESHTNEDAEFMIRLPIE